MKQVVTLSVLLAAALVGSYATWTAPESAATSQGVPVYTVGATDLQKVEWRSESLDVVLEKLTDERGEYVRVTTTERREVPVEDPDPIAEAADPAATDAEPAADEAPGDDTDAPAEPAEPATRVEETRRTFVGNQMALDLWDDLAPLVALRDLGPADALDAAALGFEEPHATLVVHRKSGPLELAVGGETYGNRDRYVRHGGRVVLVDDLTLRPLIYANARLVERALQPFAEKDVQRVEIADGEGRATTLVHQNAADPAKAFWARSESPDAADAAAGTWLGKLFRLRLLEHVDAAEVEGELAPVFRYTVHGRDGAWSVEVLSAGEGDDVRYYARSDYNRGLVQLTQSLAAETIADLGAALPR